MKKLLYITNQVCGPGGLERVLSIKASFLAEEYDYEVNVLTLNQPEEDLFFEFSPKIIYHNIKVGGNPLKYFLSYRKGIKQSIKKINPDIVIVCDDGLKGLLFPILIGKHCPTIYERHVSKNIEIKTENISGLNSFIQKMKFKLMDIGGSKFDKFIALTNGNLNEWNINNILVIPNPLSFQPNESSTLKNKKVIAVGKQSYQKGYDRLLKSWQLVTQKHPDWTLEIYGTINKSEGLNELATKLKIEKNINFFEPVKNIHEKYIEASIYCMSSRYEGFGMVLTEAMSYGVPCISFDCPHGPSDIITDKKNGFLIKNGAIEEFALAINKLIENDDERISMGKEAKKTIDFYSIERIGKLWDSLFIELTKSAS